MCVYYVSSTKSFRLAKPDVCALGCHPLRIVRSVRPHSHCTLVHRCLLELTTSCHGPHVTNHLAPSSVLMGVVRWMCSVLVLATFSVTVLEFVFKGPSERG